MKLLVLVNPKSGSGGAWSIYKSIVKMFEKAKIEFDPYCLYFNNNYYCFYIEKTKLLINLLYRS